jgi:hypothetical protein
VKTALYLRDELVAYVLDLSQRGLPTGPKSFFRRHRVGPRRDPDRALPRSVDVARPGARVRCPGVEPNPARCLQGATPRLHSPTGRPRKSLDASPRDVTYAHCHCCSRMRM